MFSLHHKRTNDVDRRSCFTTRARAGPGFIPGLLACASLAMAGCTEDPAPDSGSAPAPGDAEMPTVLQSTPGGPDAGTAPTPEAALGNAGGSAGVPAATGAAPSPQATQGPGDPTQVPSGQPSATLDDVMALQERILARLDSLEAERTDAGATVDSAGRTGGIDLEEARDEVTNLGYGIFWSIVVLVVFHFLIRTVIWVLETLSERRVTQRLTFKWLIPITRMLLWAFAGYLIVGTIFRVDAQGILAASAALGLALGIAAQDLLKNVFGGLIVVFDQPFQVGDKISVGDTYGEVVSIGLRSTRIVTADDDVVSVPNSQVVEEQVANANAGQLNCQVVTNLHLPGRVDERRAKEIAFEAAVNSKYVFLEKPVHVFIEDEFRTTFVTRVKVRAYVLDPRFEFLLRSDITERARDGFRAAGLAPEHDWYPLPFAADDPGAADTTAP